MKSGLTYHEKNNVIVSKISKLKRVIILNYLILERDDIKRVVQVQVINNELEFKQLFLVKEVVFLLFKGFECCIKIEGAIIEFSSKNNNIKTA